MQQLALITYTDTGNYTGISEEENSKLYGLLKEKGLNISLQIWDNPAVDWGRFDVIVLKSPWDYFDKIDAFYAWLDKLEQLKLRVLNPVEIVRWNTNKRYLLDLQQQGVRVVPTVWLEKGSTFEAAQAFAQLGTGKIIVKPAVSGGAKNTFALNPGEAAAKQDDINGLLQQESFLAQPFLEEIKTKGEWSFLFFNGIYSHAVLKTARPGDFRVQHFFGGEVRSAEPPAALLAAAQTIVDRHAPGCLYARVDGVELNNELALMELELIEPFLFMALSEGAFERYCEALLVQLQLGAEQR